MKSIKEKAKEDAYTNWQSDECHDGASEGLEFDPIGHTQKTFERGANYVIECIENALNKSFDELSIKDGYLEARKCIEQLKEYYGNN